MSLSDVDLAPFLSDAPPVPHDVWIEADLYAVFDDVQMLLLQLLIIYSVKHLLYMSISGVTIIFRRDLLSVVRDEWGGGGG